MKLLLPVAAALSSASAVTGFSPEAVPSYSVSEVSELLSELNLQGALGSYFEQHQVDGVMLTKYLLPEDIAVADSGGSRAHVRKLFGELQAHGVPTALAPAPVAARSAEGPARRHLAATASPAGVAILANDGSVTMGQDEDVSIARTGNGEVTVAADTVNLDAEQISVPSFDAVVAQDTNQTLQETCDTWTHTFLGNSPITVKKSQLVTRSFQAAAEYELSIDIRPFGTYNGWTNVFHFTATEDNCCTYGDRIPALFLYANTARMHYVFGAAVDLDDDTTNTGNVNVNAPSGDTLPMNEWTTVTLRVEGQTATIYLNGTYYVQGTTETRHPHDQVAVYLSDPWHKEAQVEVKNFKYKVLSYLQTHGYEHELDATESLGQYDDGALKIIDYAIDFQYPITVPSLGSIIDGSTGKTVQEACEEWTHIFIGDDPVEVKADQLLTSDFQAAADYELTIDMKPTGTYNGWTNVFHFTVTGDDCCNYGDRIPALFIYANTPGRFHWVMGSAYDVDMDSDQAESSGNVGNTRLNMDEGDSIPLDSWTSVRFRVVGATAEMYLNGTLYGSVETDTRHPHDEVMVYLSDGWYEEAKMEVKNFKYKVMSYVQSDAYSHDLDSSSSLGQY